MVERIHRKSYECATRSARRTFEAARGRPLTLVNLSCVSPPLFSTPESAPRWADSTRSIARTHFATELRNAKRAARESRSCTQRPPSLGAEMEPLYGDGGRAQPQKGVWESPCHAIPRAILQILHSFGAGPSSNPLGSKLPYSWEFLHRIAGQRQRRALDQGTDSSNRCPVSDQDSCAGPPSFSLLVVRSEPLTVRSIQWF